MWFSENFVCKSVMYRIIRILDDVIYGIEYTILKTLPICMIHNDKLKDVKLQIV